MLQWNSVSQRYNRLSSKLTLLTFYFRLTRVPPDMRFHVLPHRNSLFAITNPLNGKKQGKLERFTAAAHEWDAFSSWFNRLSEGPRSAKHSRETWCKSFSSIKWAAPVSSLLWPSWCSQVWPFQLNIVLRIYSISCFAPCCIQLQYKSSNFVQDYKLPFCFSLWCFHGSISSSPLRVYVWVEWFSFTISSASWGPLRR